jgi:hypothetical protein
MEATTHEARRASPVNTVPGDIAGLARTMASVCMILSAIGVVIIIAALWRTNAMLGIAIGVGGLVSSLVPLMALHLIADVRDAAWYLAAREERR